MPRAPLLLTCAACLVAACEPKGPGGEGAPPGAGFPVGEATRLDDDAHRWSTVFTPIVAISDAGRVYVLSAQTFDASLVVPEGVPVIPSEMIQTSELNTITTLAFHDGDGWAPAQALVGIKYRLCIPRFVWCDGEDLNLLVEMADSGLHHLRYSPESRAWNELAPVPAPREAPRCDFEFRPEDRSVHVAAAGAGKVSYFRYDGGAWSEPVVWESGGEFLSPKVAVAGDGTAHVVWTTWGSGTRHAVVADAPGEAAEIGPDGCPIMETETEPFDLCAGADGRMLLAFKADLPKGHADRESVHVRTWDGSAWSAPAPAARSEGRLLDMVKLARSRSRAFLMWREEKGPAAGGAPGPRAVWSCSVQGAGGEWSAPAEALRLPGDAGALGESALCLHVDRRGLVHVAWSDDVPSTHHAVVADLSE